MTPDLSLSQRWLVGASGKVLPVHHFEYGAQANNQERTENLVSKTLLFIERDHIRFLF